MRIRLFAFAAALAFAAMSVPAAFAAPTPRLRIIATTFPLYDWTRQVLGSQASNVKLTQLQDNGVDLHSFQPTVKDIAALSQCDLFLHVGGESDQWVEGALRSPRNPKRIVLNLLRELGDAAREEVPLEGMEAHHHHHDHHGDVHEGHHHEKEHGEHHRHHEKEHEGHRHEKEHGEHHHHDEDDHDDDDHDEEEKEIDEHIWLSLRCASRLCHAIADRLAKLDPPHAEEYRTNCKNYVAALAALDAQYAALVKAAPSRTLLFADRFPFRYLAEDYGLTCFAAFSGCSAETEASFKTIVFLAQKVDELRLPAVLVLEGRRHKIAETVVKTAKSRDVKILTMDSLQSATSRDMAKGKTYLNTMTQNLAVLKTALGTSN